MLLINTFALKTFFSFLSLKSLHSASRLNLENDEDYRYLFIDAVNMSEEEEEEEGEKRRGYAAY